MSNRNIQMKKKNNDIWENLFPLSLNENIFNTNGLNLNDQLDNINNIIDGKISDQDTVITNFKNETNTNLSKITESIPFVSATNLSGESNIKSLIRFSKDRFILTTRKKTGEGYIQFAFERNIGTDPDEVNYGGSKELLRLVGVYNGDGISEHFIWKTPESFSGVGFSIKEYDAPQYYYPSKIKTFSNSGDPLISTSYLEFEVDMNDLPNKELRLMFYPSGNSNQELSVLINGNEVSTFNTRHSNFSISSVNLSKFNGIVTVRLNPSEVNRIVHFIGYNAYSIKNAKKGIKYDNAIYNLTEGGHYIQGSGANDYAIKEKNGKWMGSFHGGETVEEIIILMDQQNVTNMSIGSIVFGSKFQIIQRTNIINKLISNNVTTIENDATYSFEGTFKVLESFNISDLYIAMTCSRIDFTKMLVPHVKNIVGDTNFDNIGKIIQMNPLTNQQITTLFNIENEYHGVNNTYVRLNENYSKVYHGKVVESDIPMMNLSFNSVKIFD